MPSYFELARAQDAAAAAGYDGNGGGPGSYNGGTKLEGIANLDAAKLDAAKLAEMRAMGYVAQAQRENQAKQYLAQAMPSINFGEIRAEAKAPSAPAANEQTQEKAKQRYDEATAQYETQSKQLDKLLAQTGDYAGYGADLEKAKTSTADAKAKMEEAASRTPGVKEAVVNFMLLKMNVEFEDGADPKAVMAEVLRNCKKVESDCEIYLK